MIKQGRRFRYRSLVVMCNGLGAAGFGVGKGQRPRMALLDARRSCVKDIVMTSLTRDRGLFHDVMGECNNTKVVIRTAKPGSGLTAGRIVAAVLDCFGIRHATAKVIGRRNPFTVVNATFNALGKHESTAQLATRRGQRVPFDA